MTRPVNEGPYIPSRWGRGLRPADELRWCARDKVSARSPGGITRQELQRVGLARSRAIMKPVDQHPSFLLTLKLNTGFDPYFLVSFLLHVSSRQASQAKAGTRYGQWHREVERYAHTSPHPEDVTPHCCHSWQTNTVIIL